MTSHPREPQAQASDGTRSSRWPDRVWLHVDLDAFFAQVEEIDNPRLAGVPLIVGGSRKSDGSVGRGVVSTCNYPAREFGVRSGMALATALRLCPRAELVPVRFDRYRAFSERTMEVVHRFSPACHVVGCDEAYLELDGLERWATHHAADHPLDGPDLHKAPSTALGTASTNPDFDWASYCAAALRRSVRTEAGLSCSVGVGPNRFLAKIASDHNKPGGVTVVTPAHASAFVAGLPLRDLRGVGPATAERLAARGIRSGRDLVERTRDEIEALASEFGVGLWEAAHGAASTSRPRAGVGSGDRSQRKSISQERTFSDDVTDRAELRATLARLTAKCAYTLRERGLSAACVTTKLRFADFTTLQRDAALSRPDAGAIGRSSDDRDFFPIAERMLDELLSTRTPEHRLKQGVVAPVRLVGVKLSRFGESGGRQMLLGEAEQIEQRTGATRAADAVRKKLGAAAVQPASALAPKKRAPKKRGTHPAG